VRVVQTETGGGFGGKEEYPSMIAGHAALLARKSGGRSSWSTTASRTCWRRPSAIRRSIRTDGRDARRRLTAIDIDAVFDGGAYATLSAVVLSRGMIHASGPYRCDHVRIRGARR
jgi:xanthine dehydrogenase molybdopterin-binding subunit B